MVFDTESLKDFLISDDPEKTEFIRQIGSPLEIAHLYHLARCADALDSIAITLKNGQIATLDGENIVKALNEIEKELMK